MRKPSWIVPGIFIALSIAIDGSITAAQTHPWLGVHILMTNRSATEQLTRAVGKLSQAGINTIVAEINYGYEFESHPELRGGNASGKQLIANLVAECRKNNIRLIPQFQCLGHQSWAEQTYPLLTKYPQFDETPDQYPKNKGIYCRSWCPLHPEVNPIIFDLMDELIDTFEADAFHVGMDEVFLLGDDACPRCKSKDNAELFAQAIKDYHGHLVGKRKVEMLIWGDRLIDAEKIPYGEWEASANHTAGAIDLIPKEIVVCDWHYEPRQAYESIPMFLDKGFRVWPASWKNPKAAKGLINYSQTFPNPRMLGHLNTTWGSVPINELPQFEPLIDSIRSFAANPKTYLSDIKDQLRKEWPSNRTINIVCHGHSVPAGYFKTPIVDTFNAYPHLLHQKLAAQYPHAVINVIVTAIGGENSDSGVRRFEKDVLSLQPDVITIDYALNDRGIGVDKARENLTSMIQQSKARGIKVILLTPTGDLSAKWNDPEDPLNQQARLIRDLAAFYHIGLADSTAEFNAFIVQGGRMEEIMSQVNHPNRKGHELVAQALSKWFIDQE